jgi:hypothetical protein
MDHSQAVKIKIKPTVNISHAGYLSVPADGCLFDRIDHQSNRTGTEVGSQ